jgi:hypothetical protein
MDVSGQEVDGVVAAVGSSRANKPIASRLARIDNGDMRTVQLAAI